MTPMTPPVGAPKKSNNVLIVVLVVGGLCMFCCVGTIALIAVPNFIKFSARSKQAEVKSGLSAGDRVVTRGALFIDRAAEDETS